MPDYRAQFEPVARAAARKYDVPESMFARQILRESTYNPNAVSPAGARGIAQFMPDTAAGLGVDPMDPIASLDAAAAYDSRLYRKFGKWSVALAAYNAGEGNVQDYGGVPPFPETIAYLDFILGEGWPEPAMVSSDPKRATTTDELNIRAAPSLAGDVRGKAPKGTSVYLTGNRVTDDECREWWEGGPLIGWMSSKYLTQGQQPAPIVTPGFDPDTPMITQQHDWDCAEQSTWWALTAIGRHPSDAWMENSMLSAYVESTEIGLTDATGAKLAAWIRDQYGEFGIGAHNLPAPSFDDIARLAGGTPILAGARNWSRPVDGKNNRGHWCGVRRFRDDVLELAQPGGHGPIYGQQAMDRDGWAARGPWSAVVITKGG